MSAKKYCLQSVKEILTKNVNRNLHFFVFLRVSHPVTSLASSTNEKFLPEDSRFLFSEILILKLIIFIGME